MQLDATLIFCWVSVLSPFPKDRVACCLLSEVQYWFHFLKIDFHSVQSIGQTQSYLHLWLAVVYYIEELSAVIDQGNCSPPTYFEKVNHHDASIHRYVYNHHVALAFASVTLCRAVEAHDLSLWEQAAWTSEEAPQEETPQAEFAQEEAPQRSSRKARTKRQHHVWIWPLGTCQCLRFRQVNLISYLRKWKLGIVVEMKEAQGIRVLIIVSSTRCWWLQLHAVSTHFPFGLKLLIVMKNRSGIYCISPSRWWERSHV